MRFPSHLIPAGLAVTFAVACSSNDSPADSSLDSATVDASEQAQLDPSDVGLDAAIGARQDAAFDKPVAEEPDADVDSPDAAGTDAVPWFPQGWIPAEPWTEARALCDIPGDWVESGGDPMNPPCIFAANALSDRDRYDVPDVLRVVAWNVEFGKAHDDVMAELASNPDLRDASIVLLCEVARNDQKSAPRQIDQLRLIAEVMKMNYVGGLEWDRREHEDEGGEHVIAILSKYPLGNVGLLRHTPQKDWWGDERLYGGHATMFADTLVGDDVVRLYSTHLDTRGFDSGRAEQGAEIRAHAELPGAPSMQIAGGDFNTYTCNPIAQDCTSPPAAETVIKDFFADGWFDGTAGYEGETQLGAGFLPQRLDWILYRGLVVAPGVALPDARGSDHYPLYADIISRR